MSKVILEKKGPCWKGYKQLGMKKKTGKKVPNCVPVDEFFLFTAKRNKKKTQNLHTVSKQSKDKARELIDKEIERRKSEREKLRKEETDPKGPIKAYKSVAEICKKHNVSEKQIHDQLRQGMKIEKEHTNNSDEARIIALQHLEEDPKYYTKLKKVESKGTKSESISFEIGSGHKQANREAKIGKIARDKRGNEHEIKVAKSKLKGPKLPIKEEQIDETMRIQTRSGNLMSVIVSWRGRYYQLQMFFPTLRVPSRKEVSFEIQKIYPDSKLIHYKLAPFDANKPIIHSNIRESK